MNVTIQESLLYYDCDLLFEAADDSGQRYIAVHDDDCETMGREYIVAPATRKNLASFKAGKLDLRSLLLSAPKGVWYAATLSVESDEITLTRQNAPISDCGVLPDKGYYLVRSDFADKPLSQTVIG